MTKAGKPRFDVAVIGGGVAGSAASLALARAGAAVLQLIRPERLNLPNEVLSPPTRRKLLSAGFDTTIAQSISCTGVLSSWASVEPDFSDYRLMTGMEGLSVQRQHLHHALNSCTKMAGPELHFCSRIERPSARSVAWENEKGGRMEADYGTLFLAVGHRTRFGLGQAGDRIHLDRGLAFATEFHLSDHCDKLIIEAAHDGWWYVSPAGRGESHLVFVTHSGVVPREKASRDRWLVKQFEESNLIRNLAAAPPDFATSIGINTHFGFHRRLTDREIVRIGGAAFSLDPLMGNGIGRAVDALQVAIAEYLEKGFVSQVYCDFVASILQQEIHLRSITYSLASGRFKGSQFWRSKRSILSLIG